LCRLPYRTRFPLLSLIVETARTIRKSKSRKDPASNNPSKPRVRGRKPHDPRFAVRTARYYLSGVNLTAIEGIDALHALTLFSELGTDFSKWPTVKHFTSWLGLCSGPGTSLVR
jgi:hypothetical protein